MAANVFPVSYYEELLPKLVAVLELTQQPAGTSTPESKQRLLQAANNFKNALAQAKDVSGNLPGGELRIEEQDDLIYMLETLRDRKRAQLAEFSAKKIISRSVDITMEVDSLASTPNGSVSDE
ncbi:hypothetical protein HYPSUDRAFT_151399 [Hypholoma sublateritium FD-334 SS-4]|uniref:Mediator of RNA polymerase II transcription subunit 9 n=1 Tax=Hypholoma sublateritium (strain FD-334 SS-4) TaxID=945553 RepID=A0A0D2NAI8_HYPSF|nr:hypothetical protein HYPSUDRAFT_151399 [Hypholoma sublateritium FD-334 SS-4]